MRARRSQARSWHRSAAAPITHRPRRNTAATPSASRAAAGSTPGDSAKATAARQLPRCPPRRCSTIRAAPGGVAHLGALDEVTTTQANGMNRQPVQPLVGGPHHPRRTVTLEQFLQSFPQGAAAKFLQQSIELSALGGAERGTLLVAL